MAATAPAPPYPTTSTSGSGVTPPPVRYIDSYSITRTERIPAGPPASRRRRTPGHWLNVPNRIADQRNWCPSGGVVCAPQPVRQLVGPDRDELRPLVHRARSPPAQGNR